MSKESRASRIGKHEEKHGKKVFNVTLLVKKNILAQQHQKNCMSLIKTSLFLIYSKREPGGKGGGRNILETDKALKQNIPRDKNDSTAVLLDFNRGRQN